MRMKDELHRGALTARLAAGALLAGACTSNNVPVSTRFPAVVDRPVTASVFLDLNGSFYPDEWHRMVTAEELQRGGSLLAATHGDDRRRDWLKFGEQAQLEALRQAVTGKRRVFIITHGFNNDAPDAGHAFDLVEQRIAWEPGDVLIKVYWDGLLGSAGGQGIIWFPSTAASQLVGSRGVRKILNLLQGQEVLLISHSRGASVLLSALANPTYSWPFQRETRRFDFSQNDEYLRPPPLQENGNSIRLIMLAPAIGYPDFWSEDCEQTETERKRCDDPVVAEPTAPTGSRCKESRAFSTQVKSMFHTLNSADNVLGKKVGNLSRHFNATDMGFNALVGRRLAACYAFPITGYTIATPHRHPFTRYAQDPELADMLRAANVTIRH